MAKATRKAEPKPTDATVTGRELGNEFWWRAAIDQPVHDKLVPFGKALRDLYRAAHQQDRAFERIYEARRLRGYQQALKVLQQAHGFSAARLNVVKAVIDTVVSRLSKNRPMPAFDVDDADYMLKRKAKEYRKFIVGKMNETEFDDLSRDALRDGGVLGTGITCIDARLDDQDTDDVFAERVLREEWLFDPRECRYGRPQQAVRVYRIARAYLAELYPEHAAAIYRAPDSAARPQEDDADDTGRSSDLSGYVDVFRAWHLPTLQGGTDGRDALVIEGATLYNRAWESCRFPAAFFRYCKPQKGVWGKGLTAELADIQDRINSIVRDMQMNIAATGRGYYAVNEANDLPAAMLTAFAPFKLPYKGNTPPKFEIPTPFNPAQLQALQFFISQAFELTGVSQAAASSKSSLGMGASGVALDTQYDIESERFAMVEAQYARYRMDAAQLYLDAVRRVAKRRHDDKGKKRSFVAMWRAPNAIERLEYDQVKLEEQDYSLRLEPMNYIPDTRAGKLSVVSQLSSAGIIPQWQVAMLFDEPDLAGANRIELAPLRNCLRKMDELWKLDIAAPVPEPYNDLDLEFHVSKCYYNLVQEERAPEEVQERYRTYVDLVEGLIKRKKQGEAALAAPAAQVAGPPAMPGTVPAMPTPMEGAPPQLQALPGGLA